MDKKKTNKTNKIKAQVYKAEFTIEEVKEMDAYFTSKKDRYEVELTTLQPSGKMFLRFMPDKAFQYHRDDTGNFTHKYPEEAAPLYIEVYYA